MPILVHTFEDRFDIDLSIYRPILMIDPSITLLEGPRVMFCPWFRFPDFLVRDSSGRFSKKKKEKRKKKPLGLALHSHRNAVQYSYLGP